MGQGGASFHMGYCYTFEAMKQPAEFLINIAEVRSVGPSALLRTQRPLIVHFRKINPECHRLIYLQLTRCGIGVGDRPSNGAECWFGCPLASRNRRLVPVVGVAPTTQDGRRLATYQVHWPSA